MSVWSTAFESYPTGSSFGSSSGSAIRALRSAVQTRLALEHTFDEDVTPECPHIPGQCRIVGFSDGEPSYQDVIGALWFDHTNNILYRDRGSGLGGDAIAIVDHSMLLNLTDDEAHTKYVLASGNDADIASLHTYDSNAIYNLPVDEDAAWSEEDIISVGAHIGESVHGGAKHADEVIGAEINSILITNKMTYLKRTTEAMDETFSGIYSWVFSGRCAFFLTKPDAVDAQAGATLLPLFNVTPPDDYKAGISFYVSGGTPTRLRYTIQRVAES